MGRIKTLTHNGRRHLPLPTGPYTVGCCDVMTSYVKFGSFSRIFYPTKADNIIEKYLQWPLWIPHKEYINGYAQSLKLPFWLCRFLHMVLIGDLYIPTVWQGRLKESDEKYPVIILSHGLTGFRNAYSSICMELASHGFIVAALEHRDYSACASFYVKQRRMSSSGPFPGAELRNLPDGKLNFGQSSKDLGPTSHAEEWLWYQKSVQGIESEMRNEQLKHRAKECAEALDMLQDLNAGRFINNVLDSKFDLQMFKNCMDLKNTFFIGHSFGAATGFRFLPSEVRFKACVLMDPWMFPFYANEEDLPVISLPLLCVLVESFQTEQSLKLLEKLKDANKTSQFVILQHAYHRDLSDVPFVKKDFLPSFVKFGQSIEKFEALDLATDLILEYLGNHIGKSIVKCDAEKEALKNKFIKENAN